MTEDDYLKSYNFLIVLVFLIVYYEMVTVKIRLS